MRSIAIRLGIIAAIVVAFLVFRPFLSGNASSLQVGDCFDVPTGTQTIDDVQHHPCTDPHGAEVVLIGTYEPSTTTFPSDAEFQDFVADKCLPAFDVYTGRSYETASELGIEWFTPTEESWKDGSRKVICYAVSADQATPNLSKSIKKT
jgi:hypothetical protein